MGFFVFFDEGVQVEVVSIMVEVAFSFNMLLV